jgi:hypothetical protein
MSFVKFNRALLLARPARIAVGTIVAIAILFVANRGGKHEKAPTVVADATALVDSAEATPVPAPAATASAGPLQALAAQPAPAVRPVIRPGRASAAQPPSPPTTLTPAVLAQHSASNSHAFRTYRKLLAQIFGDE